MRRSVKTHFWRALVGVALFACSEESSQPGGVSANAGMDAPAAGAPATGGAASVAGSGGAGGPVSGSSAGSDGSSAAGSGAAGGAGAAGADAGGAAAGSGGEPASMTPFPAPVADDCITDVTPGDHAFECQGQNFLVMVDERCTTSACGLIFDVHGASMTGEVMRANTQLHELAPKEGFLVVHPSDPNGAWDLVNDPPILADFMTRMIKAFHVDEKRVHMTGFSMGSAMTFWFLCNRREILASAAPVTGASAEQVRVADTDMPCIASIGADWTPRVPILFMSGTSDGAFSIANARARAEGLVMRLGLTGGDQTDGDETYARKRWTGDDGMVFDFLEHDYSNSLLQGHCIPGGPPNDFIACTEGGESLHWGKTVLEWMKEHSKT